MNTTPLVPNNGHTRATHITHARRLAADVESLGGTLPTALCNLLDAHALLTSPQDHSDPLAAIVDTAATGALTAKKLSELVDAGAQARASTQFRGELAARAHDRLVQRFGHELLNGAADEILDSVRPKFDDAAATIEDALKLVDLRHDYQAFIDEADPDALAAYQRLKPAVATITEIIALAIQFGPRSITFPLITRPDEGIGHEEFSLDDAAIFTATASLVVSTSKHMRDYTAAVASQRSISPTNMGMRFSPWLRGGLRLNTISEARETVRAWAEQQFDSALTPGLVGRLRNPYALDDERRGAVVS
jgi:hypothetical protein